MLPIYLQIERQRKGLTQKELAKVLGISRSYIAAIETQREKPKSGHVKDTLESYFKMPMEKLQETINI